MKIYLAEPKEPVKLVAWESPEGVKVLSGRRNASGTSEARDLRRFRCFFRAFRFRY